MSQALDQIIETLLYEGFILYPYRPSARKNQQRFTFGRVYPQAYSLSEKGAERCASQTECLATTTEKGQLEVSVRFLQPVVREVGLLEAPVAASNWNGISEPVFQVVPEVRIDGALYQTWQEAVERRIQMPPLGLGTTGRTAAMQFSFGASRTLEPIADARGEVRALFVRRQEALEGTAEVTLRSLGGNLVKLTVRVLNQTPMAPAEIGQPEAVLLRTMASTHTVLQLRGADFISLLDPSPEHKQAAQECVNLGTWPILVGDQKMGQRDTMLSSPIILYDYPQIAPQSPGSFFDGTEIDELLALCVQALTDEEKQEMRTASQQSRRLLERTESLSGAEWLGLHGIRRDAAWSADEALEPPSGLKEVTLDGASVRVGDRVRLKPQGRADIFDLALRGRIAQIEAIEQDFENRVHIAVVLESDPGKDLGLLRQPGHRFFFGVDELEPVPAEPAARSVEEEASDA